MIKTRKTVVSTIIPLILVCSSPAWAQEVVDSVRLTVRATLVTSGCQITVEGGPDIRLASVAASDIRQAGLAAPISEGHETVNVTINQCEVDGQYSLQFTGEQVENYPGAIASDSAVQGVAHYLKYVDPTGTFYPDGTLLGDGSKSSGHHMDATAAFRFQLEAGYMRVGDTVTSGNTTSTVTVNIIQN